MLPSLPHDNKKKCNYFLDCKKLRVSDINLFTYLTNGLISLGRISSIILGVIIVPRYGILLYHWSIIIPSWVISLRTLNETTMWAQLNWIKMYAHNYWICHVQLRENLVNMSYTIIFNNIHQTSHLLILINFFLHKLFGC